MIIVDLFSQMNSDRIVSTRGVSSELKLKPAVNDVFGGATRGEQKQAGSTKPTCYVLSHLLC